MCYTVLFNAQKSNFNSLKSLKDCFLLESKSAMRFSTLKEIVKWKEKICGRPDISFTKHQKLIVFNEEWCAEMEQDVVVLSKRYTEKREKVEVKFATWWLLYCYSVGLYISHSNLISVYTHQKKTKTDMYLYLLSTYTTYNTDDGTSNNGQTWKCSIMLIRG